MSCDELSLSSNPVEDYLRRKIRTKTSWVNSQRNHVYTFSHTQNFDRRSPSFRCVHVTGLDSEGRMRSRHDGITRDAGYDGHYFETRKKTLKPGRGELWTGMCVTVHALTPVNADRPLGYLFEVHPICRSWWLHLTLHERAVDFCITPFTAKHSHTIHPGFNSPD